MHHTKSFAFPDWAWQKNPVINEVISEAKRLMSYSIVSRLKKKNATALLTQLHEAVSDYERKKGIIHKVFEDSFDGKECYTYDFIQQKLHYMHVNPVKAGVVKLPEEYAHYSALFYDTGVQGIYPVKHYADIYEELYISYPQRFFQVTLWEQKNGLSRFKFSAITSLKLYD